MGLSRNIWAFLLTAMLFHACSSSKQEPDLLKLGYQYYPLEVGNYRIYDVETINFSLLEGGDTNRYQLKEVIHDYYYQGKEDTTFYLYRYSRAHIGEDWSLDSIWTVRKDSRRIIVVENNVPLLKLIFPAYVGLTWDGNSMNAEEEAIYSISKMGDPLEKAGARFEKTLHVVEKNNMDTVINERYKEAVYAANIGLVYEEQRYINYCATTVECLGEGIIESGIKYELLLREYGKE